MRIIHTMWGEPAKESPKYRDIYSWMYALSACYIKRNEDAVMVLYADKIGMDILKDILYLYDEVHEVQMPNTISPKFFAAIKAVALSREPLGSVHIDGDVMFKDVAVWNRLKYEMSTCDVTTQGIEPNSDAYAECNFWSKLGITFDCQVMHNRPCNVGVLGFSNETLKKHYLDNYNRSVTKATYMNRFEDCGIPDIVIEQAYLASYCKQEGYHVGEIVSGVDWPTISNNAKKLGYCHLWSASKVYNFTLIKRRLKENFKDVYEKLLADTNRVNYNVNYIGEL